jgi:hypothetical protein
MGKRGAGLLEQIEQDVLDESTPTAAVLRKCLLLGGHAGSTELRDWARKELHGYDSVEELPDYRWVPAPVKIDAQLGPRQFSQTIHPHDLPAEVQKAGIDERVPFFGPLAELEDLASQDKDFHQMSLPHASTILKIIAAENTNPRQAIDRVYWEVSKPAIRGMVDHVRTTLVELIAELIATVPEADGTPSKEAVDNALTLAITGKRHKVTVISSVASTGGTSSIVPPKTTEDDEPWWRRWRKRGLIIGFSTFVAAAVGVAAWLQWTPWK